MEVYKHWNETLSIQKINNITGLEETHARNDSLEEIYNNKQ